MLQLTWGQALQLGGDGRVLILLLLLLSWLLFGFFFLSEMLLKIVMINVVKVHILDVLHKVWFLRRLLRGLRRLSLHQNSVARTYVDFLAFIWLGGGLRLSLLFERGLALPFDGPILLLGGVLVAVLRFLVPHSVVIDVGLKAILTNVNLIALLLLVAGAASRFRVVPVLLKLFEAVALDFF